MNKFRWIATLVVSILMGAIAVGLAASWLGNKADIATTEVVVAARDVEISSTLSKEQLTVVSWPTLSVPKGYVSNPDLLVGRVVSTSMVRGEPVLEAKLSPPGSKGGLSALIAPGKRAVTVRVNEVIGVAGFALPGNYVDILVNARDDSGTDVSKIILEKVLVLAVAQQADRDETKPKVVNAVTVELSPSQVEVLDLARSVGQLSLVLRNQFESAPVATGGARRQDLVGGRARAATPVAAAPAASAPVKRVAPVVVEQKPYGSVEVIRGLSKSTADISSK